MARTSVRMTDIAKRLGLTVNTISRALRNSSDISEKTRQLVKKTADEMGYVPNIIASSLRLGKTKSLAIIFDNLVNPYFMIMANAIHERAQMLGYDTMIYTPSVRELTGDELKTVIKRHVEAVITFLEPSKEVIDLCVGLSLPLFLVGRKISDLRIDSISSDDYYGGYQAAERLISSGAKRIGYLGAHKNTECSVRRQKGLIYYLSKNNHCVIEDAMRFMPEEDVAKEIDILIKNDIDGIFCFNDMIAIKAIMELDKRGLRVPNDIKIVGYDNIQAEIPQIIQMTSVFVNQEEVVNRLFQILLKKMNNYGKETVQVELKTNLFIGKTC